MGFVLSEWQADGPMGIRRMTEWLEWLRAVPGYNGTQESHSS